MSPSTAMPWTLTARWIFPASSPPLADGIVTIAGERIVSVEPNGRRRIDIDLGDCAILPGFVNAHTHLDLSGLRGRCPPSRDFPAWLRQLIAHRLGTPQQQIEADIRTGLAESLRHGTTLLGDISAGGASWPILADAPIGSVIFYEVLGLTKARAEKSLQAARNWLEAHPATNRCRPGLSPHAPYSVRADLFARSALAAQSANCPLALHLAESREELELLKHHTGPFVPFLKDLGVWDANGLATGPASLMRICYQHALPRSHALRGNARLRRSASRPHQTGDALLFVHGNYLLPSACVPSHSTIIYCPRTHSAFGHAPHPFRHFLQRGIRIALGTDSLASNPDLSILAEMRHLHRRCSDLPGEVVLRMATLSGAEALGWADETGSLEAGKSADLVVVPLTCSAGKDPYVRLFDSGLPVQRALCRGRWIEHLESATERSYP